MKLEEVLRKLCDLEINVTISSFWEAGWTALLDDEAYDFNTIQQMTEFLLEELNKATERRK